MNEATKTIEELIQFHKECLLKVKITSSVSPELAVDLEPVIQVKEALVKHYEAILASDRSEWYLQWMRREMESEETNNLDTVRTRGSY